MKMPTSIKVGAQVFTIVERSKKEDGMLNDDSYAYTLDAKNLIVMDKDIPISKKQSTVFHELMHATRMVFENPIKPRKNMEYEEWEHHFIGIWEQSLLLVLRDNPDLVDWLLEDH